MSDGRSSTRRLATVFATLVVVAVVVLGVLILQDFNRALTPELERRADLIGTTVVDDVERAVELGIPLEELVGVEAYVAALIEDFDELESVRIRDAAGVVLHAGGRPGGEATVSTYPLQAAGASIGRVEVGVDPRFVGSRLEDLALDLAVIVSVALVLAYELSVAMRGRVAGRRREGLAGMLDVRLVLLVFVIADELSKSFLPQFTLTTTDPASALDPALAVSLPIVAYLLALGLASLFAGRLTARLGERRLLAIGLVVAAGSHLGMAYATELHQVVLLRGLTGIGYAIVTIACLEYALERSPDTSRFRAMGAFVAVVIGGTFAGTALGGILADRLGYRPVFLISVVLIAATALLAWRLLAPDRRRSERRDDLAFSMRDLGAVLRQPRLLALLAGVTVPMNVLLAAFLWYLVPLTLAATGEGAAAIARTLMLYYLAILLCGPLVDRIAGSGFDTRILVGAGSVISGAVLLLPATGVTTLTVSAAVVVVGVGHAAIRGPQLTLAVELGETDAVSVGRGATLAALRSLERLGALVGLVIAAVVAASTDLLVSMAVVGIAVAAAGIVYLALAVLTRKEVGHG